MVPLQAFLSFLPRAPKFPLPLPLPLLTPATQAKNWLDHQLVTSYLVTIATDHH